jgi:hypothetical protein
MTALQPGLPLTVVDAITTTGAKDVFALPARACLLAWQTSFNIAPGTFNATLQVSIDGVSFTTLDTSTAVGGETRTIDTPTAAVFGRINVVTNDTNKELTVVVIAKTTW